MSTPEVPNVPTKPNSMADKYLMDYKAFRGSLVKAVEPLEGTAAEKHLVDFTKNYKTFILEENESDINKAEMGLREVLSRVSKELDSKSNQIKQIVEKEGITEDKKTKAQEKLNNISKARKEIDDLYAGIEKVTNYKNKYGVGEEGVSISSKEFRDQWVGLGIFVLGVALSSVTFGAGLAGAVAVTAWNARDSKQKYKEHRDDKESTVSQNRKALSAIDQVNLAKTDKEREKVAITPPADKPILRGLSYLGTGLAVAGLTVAVAGTVFFPPAAILTIPLGIAAAATIGASLSLSAKNYGSDYLAVNAAKNELEGKPSLWERTTASLKSLFNGPEQAEKSSLPDKDDLERHSNEIIASQDHGTAINAKSNGKSNGPDSTAIMDKQLLAMSAETNHLSRINYFSGFRSTSADVERPDDVSFHHRSTISRDEMNIAQALQKTAQASSETAKNSQHQHAAAEDLEKEQDGEGGFHP